MNHVTYRKGIKFFNESRFHEAHEAWECHWLHMDDSPERRFLQGMLKVASALNKYEHGNQSAVGKLLESGFHYLGENMSAEMGIDKKIEKDRKSAQFTKSRIPCRQK
jgi:predicted metal-dependent hydrolase